MPRGKALRHFSRLRREPLGKGCFRRLARLGLARFAFVHQRLRLGHGAGGERGLVTEVGFRGGAGLAVLVNRVEERGEPVEVRVRERVVFVRVALDAVEREAEPNRADGVHAVNHVVHARLLGVTAAFAVGHVIAVEARRQLLFRRRVRQKVAGELLARELVELHVRVEGGNDPVAPWPVGTRGIGLITIRVRIARGIEPPHRHALAEMLGLQQSGDDLIEGIRRTVGEEGVQLRRCRRQAGEVVGDTAKQRVLRGLGRGFQLLLREPGKDEPVNRALGSSD